MAYVDLADFILDDLFGFASANAIKNNVAYLHDTVLGDPTANGDAIETSDAILHDATLNDPLSLGEIKGDRVTLTLSLNPSGSLASLDSTFWTSGTALSTFSGSHYGFVMPRAGSLVGFGILAVIGGYVSGSVLSHSCRKWNSGAGTTDLQTVAITGIGSNAIFQNYATYARGVSTFVAGDTLGFFMLAATDVVTSGTQFLTGIMDLVFDT